MEAKLKAKAREKKLSVSKSVSTAVEFWIEYEEFLPELMILKRKRKRG